MHVKNNTTTNLELLECSETTTSCPTTTVVHSYEEAIELTGNGYFQMIVLTISGLAMVSVFAELTSMTYVLPAAKCDLDLTISEQGFIKSIGFIGVVLTSHFWGVLTDTWGRKKVLQITLLISFIFSALSSLSFSSGTLIATRFIVGLCSNGIQGSSIAYLGEFHCTKNRSKYLSFGTFFTTFGSLTQCVFGLVILSMDFNVPLFNSFITFKPWRLYILAVSLVSGLGILVISFLPESPKFLLAMRKDEECLAVLRKVHKTNVGRSNEEYPVRKVFQDEAATTGQNIKDVTGTKQMFVFVWNQTWPLFKQPYLAIISLVNFLTFSQYFLSHGFIIWFPEILSVFINNSKKPMTMCEAVRTSSAFSIETTMKSPANANATTSVDDLNQCQIDFNPSSFIVLIIIIIAALFLCLFVTYTIKSVGEKLLVFGFMTLCLIATILLLWTANFYINMVVYCIMVHIGSMATLQISIYSEVFPTYYKGMSVCIMVLLGRMGSAAGSNVYGFLLSRNCESVFYLDSVLVVVVIIAYYFLLKRRAKVSVT